MCILSIYDVLIRYPLEDIKRHGEYRTAEEGRAVYAPRSCGGRGCARRGRDTRGRRPIGLRSVSVINLPNDTPSFYCIKEGVSKLPI